MISKDYTKTGRSCKVTFELPRENGEKKAALLGDFNNWEPAVMTRSRSGNFSLTLSLKPGSAYAFRYLLNDETWRNDPEADRLEPNQFGTANSIVEI